jgi:hypothetical protein
VDEKKIKEAAFAFADGKGSSPPLVYREQDGMLVVVLADGRKFIVPFNDVPAKAESKKQVKVTDLPAHPPARKRNGRVT